MVNCKKSSDYSHKIMAIALLSGKEILGYILYFMYIYQTPN